MLVTQEFLTSHQQSSLKGRLLKIFQLFENFEFVKDLSRIFEEQKLSQKQLKVAKTGTIRHNSLANNNTCLKSISYYSYIHKYLIPFELSVELNAHGHRRKGLNIYRL